MVEKEEQEENVPTDCW